MSAIQSSGTVRHRLWTLLRERTEHFLREEQQIIYLPLISSLNAGRMGGLMKTSDHLMASLRQQHQTKKASNS